MERVQRTDAGSEPRTIAVDDGEVAGIVASAFTYLGTPVVPFVPDYFGVSLLS